MRIMLIILSNVFEFASGFVGLLSNLIAVLAPLLTSEGE